MTEAQHAALNDAQRAWGINAEKPFALGIVNDQLVIQIGVRAIAAIAAVEHIEVGNAHEFALDVAEALDRNADDTGMTPLMRVIQGAIDIVVETRPPRG